MSRQESQCDSRSATKIERQVSFNEGPIESPTQRPVSTMDKDGKREKRKHKEKDKETDKEKEARRAERRKRRELKELKKRSMTNIYLQKLSSGKSLKRHKIVLKL